MTQANHSLPRVLPPLDASRQDSAINVFDLLARKRGDGMGIFTPRGIFLLEVLLSILAAIAIVVAGAADGEMLLHLLGGSPWLR